MKSVITFEERYALWKERRYTKPFSTMHVRFGTVCPSCGAETGGFGNCWNKAAHEVMPFVYKGNTEKVFVSYR